MKPRIFVSAVTSELGQTRQLVANVLSRLGYDPVWQDIFGTESGDLRQMLRDKIDDCEGLIQILGRAYGAEPPTADPEFGRVSYTQFEFLYARARGKKTWLIFADDGCTRDRPLEQLDRPREPSHPDPDATQAERRALQEQYRQRWSNESHLWHGVTSDAELELKVERMRDEFGELRRAFRSWQQNVTRNLLVVAVLLAVIGGGVWWTVFRQPGEVRQAVQESVTKAVTETAQEQTPQMAQAIAEQLAALQPEQIKQQLIQTIQATYKKELKQADTLSDWQKRDEAKQGAAASRDRRLSQVDEYLNSITNTIQAGDASPEFLELTRILKDQGVDEALAYIAHQESRLLEQADKLIAAQQRELRRTLAPLVEGVKLHVSKGELREAQTLCDKLFAASPDWPDALHEHVWVLIEQGDQALRYTTIDEALQHFERAEALARRLVQADSQNPEWQRDLSVSFDRLGDVFLTLGRTADALEQFEAGLKIRRVLAEADPRDAQKQRDLSISFNKLGDVFLTLGRTDDALEQFEAGLKISRVLAEADPRDAQKQFGLVISFVKLGETYRTAKKYASAIEQYRMALQLHETLEKAGIAPPTARGGLDYLKQRIAECEAAAKQ